MIVGAILVIALFSFGLQKGEYKIRPYSLNHLLNGSA